MSEFIPVEPGETYTTAGVLYDSGYYDKDLNFVSMHPKTLTFTIPNNVYYMRLSWPKGSTASMVVKGGNYPAHELNYGEYDIVVSNKNFNKLLRLKVAENIKGNIPYKSVYPKNTTFLVEESVNLYNKDAATQGYIESNGDINTSLGVLSDFIEVSEGETYRTNMTYQSGFYNSNKQFVSMFIVNTQPYTFTVPEGVKYVRISGTSHGYVVKGDQTPSSVPPYEVRLKFSSEKYRNDIIKDLGITVSPLRGLKWATLGDSIVNSPDYGYRKIISEKYDMDNINFAVDGARISKVEGWTCLKETYLEIPEDVDIITVHAGVNDYLSGITLGTMDDRDNNTFYGSCHTLLKGLLEKFYNKKIGVMTQLHAGDNSVGQIPYAKALKDVAEYYCIPCLDLFNNSGLNSNIDVVANNYFDSIKLHPNAEGHKIIARRIEKFMESL